MADRWLSLSPLVSIRFLQSQPDARLAALARAGHERAFEALVRRHRKHLLAYARKLVGADTRAEDVLQQAFLHAWIALRNGTEVDELRPWMFRIVHNCAMSTVRRRHHDYVELNEALDAAAPVDETESRLAWSEAFARLSSLPDLQRRAIVLTALEGHSHDQAADELGLSDGAVRGLIYRARAALRSAAAVIVPTPLLWWVAERGSRRVAPAAATVSELVGGGSAGIGGLLLKGGAVAMTAGAIAAAGQVVVPSMGTSHARGRGRTASASAGKLGSSSQVQANGALTAGRAEPVAVRTVAGGRAAGRGGAPPAGSHTLQRSGHASNGPSSLDRGRGSGGSRTSAGRGDGGGSGRSDGGSRGPTGGSDSTGGGSGATTGSSDSSPSSPGSSGGSDGGATTPSTSGATSSPYPSSDGGSHGGESGQTGTTAATSTYPRSGTSTSTTGGD